MKKKFSSTFDQEEQEMLDSFETDEWQRTKNFKEERALSKQAASNFLNMSLDFNKLEGINMIKAREVARTPEVPPITPEIIQLLNTLCFREDDVVVPKVDCIFIFGSAVSYKEIGDTLNALLVKNVSQQIIISGGVVNYQESDIQSLAEAEMIYDAVKHYVPKSVNVILEKQSQHTLENVVFSLDILARKPNSMCFIGKSFHAGRAYLTLKKYLPGAKLYQRSVNPLFPAALEPLNINNWHYYPEFAGRVWGEFLRIKKYGERGDIGYHNAAKDLIDQIEQSVCANLDAKKQDSN